MKVTFARTSDYQALYINGSLILEDFRLDMGEVLGKFFEMGGKITHYKQVFVVEDEHLFPPKQENPDWEIEA